MNAYVVTHWHASQTPDKEGNFVHIAGRKAGLVDYLLTLLKLNSRVVLKVSDSGLLFTESSWLGDRNVNTPLAKITSTLYGWKRPFWEAVFISFALILVLPVFLIATAMAFIRVFTGDQQAHGLVAAFIYLLVFIGSLAVGAVYYRLNRVLTLGIVTDSGDIQWLKLKRSLIENIKLDQPLAEAASKVIDELVLARCAGTQAANLASFAGATHARPASSIPVPASTPSAARPASQPLAHTANPTSAPASPSAARPTPAPSPAPAPASSEESRATCTHCSTRVAFMSKWAGTEVSCPSCGKPMLLVAS